MNLGPANGILRFLLNEVELSENLVFCEMLNVA